MKLKGSTKKLSQLVCIVLIVAMALCMSACVSSEEAQAPITDVIENGKTYGEGANEFTYKVVDKDGKELTATIKTDKTIVGEALQELNLIAGSQGAYGLYIETVNDITLDWDKDAMYWGFYINGEYAMTGIDMTEIVNGTEYTLKADK